MSRFLFLLGCALALLASSMASAAVVEHSFYVQNLTVQRLCNQHVITTVNGDLPGPTIIVQEGDTLVVYVHNYSPYNVTIHWHGVFQKLSAWADGPNMITQCPIQPGNSYTYRFRITKQEGTLWWHAHIQWLRATIHGALIIRPRSGHVYPFQKPFKEVPIVLGEWWNANVFDIENQALATGGAAPVSNAYTINGLPGDLYNCSQNQMYKLKVVSGKTYFLRIINAALNTQLFFKIANHKMTVVAVDASYTKPYITDAVLVAPGQTTDVLLMADQAIGSYYIVASPYSSSPIVPFDNTTTRGVMTYDGAPSFTIPIMPIMPAYNDTPTAFKFNSNLTGLVDGRFWVPVPCTIDENMLVTIGVGLAPCGRIGNTTCAGPFGYRFSASMNNISFQEPSSLSILQAHFFNISGVYKPNFPNKPPVELDYTNSNVNNNLPLLFAPKETSARVFKYNTTVQIVFQNTAMLTVENHPMHIHGHNFHVLAQGFGNYDPVNDPKKFNLVDPQLRNTIGVPVGGWAVIRITLNNPGVWIMHCHFDAHLGLATTFIVENGGTPESTLPPPTADLPIC